MYVARWTPGVLLFATAGAAISVALGGPGLEPQQDSLDRVTADATAMIKEGRETFRFETFGDEQVWTDLLHLNEVHDGHA